MQIILVEDVYELGKRGDVIKVKPGYGRNYLLPKGLAIAANAGNLKTIEQQRLALAKKEAKHFEEAQLLVGELGQLHVIISRKAGESGSLFGSVTTKDICSLLKTEGIQLDRRRVVLSHPIKSIGNYEVQVRPHSDVQALVLVSVCAEGDKPVNRVKRKDEESDRIVAEINAKVHELGLSIEGRTVGDEGLPEVEDAQPEPAPKADLADASPSDESAEAVEPGASAEDVTSEARAATGEAEQVEGEVAEDEAAGEDSNDSDDPEAAH